MKIDGKTVKISQFRQLVKSMDFGPGNFRPSGGTLHNTAVPTMKRTRDYPINHWRDMWKGYYEGKGWRGGPHAFVFYSGDVLLFTPFNQKGVHSPSWNGTKFGIEMCADFAIESATEGDGLRIVRTAAQMFAILYERLGLDPEGIKMHYEDRATTHACPGKHLKKELFIDMVQEYMGVAGDHDIAPSPPPPPEKGVTTEDDLNLRLESSASSAVRAVLAKGVQVVIKSRALNGTTEWMAVDVPSISRSGWVAARYVRKV